MDIAAATKVFDSLRPTSEGEPVNVHVIAQQPDRAPDFEAMRRTIAGEEIEKRDEQPARAVPEKR
jgi:hypothetical protein